MSNYEVLHKPGTAPIYMFTKGVEVEEEVKTQLENLAMLPFIHHHIAVMPDCHAGKGSTIGSVIPTTGAIIPASVGVDLGCFVGETKIPLLDGTQKTLEELANRQSHFWVYSVDKNLNIIPGKAVALKTRTDAELVRVTVSGGDEIICTPDHLFMLNNGAYKHAADLKFNDSLMPLYRRWQTRDGYESVSTGKGSSELTHVLVWKYFNGEVPKGYLIHHNNHIHFDNQPDNLISMTMSEHSAYHRAVGHKFDNGDPTFQSLRKLGILRRSEDPKKLAKMKEVGVANITKYMAERPEHFKEAVKDNGKRGAQYLAKFNVSPRTCTECGEISNNPSALMWHKRKQHSYNHKVISVEKLDRREDVYCLSVEQHHNFALSAGVFVHNCGMMATLTTIKAEQLPDNLHKIRCDIEAAVPHGRTDDGGKGDRGAWANPGDDIAIPWCGSFDKRWDAMVSKHPGLAKGHVNTINHLGTLGTGNHFIEVCLDENNRVWVVLHSGSRGVGNRIGTYFINRAKEDMQRWFINLPDKDLAYIPEGAEYFNDYIEGVRWAQEFALMNREIMMDAVMGALYQNVGAVWGEIDTVINCHHNYVEKEAHYGKNVWLTRKGAVRARKGDMGIIPGSMGVGSYIVRGKGSPESLFSCSHGAGRRMSRTRARNIISLKAHIAATEGIECRKDEEVLDESPAAYKDLNAVMAAQTDMIEIVHKLRPLICVKG